MGQCLSVCICVAILAPENVFSGAEFILYWINLYILEDTQDKIYIGKDLPDEFSGSEDTSRLKGALAKAKANIFVFCHGKMQIKQLWTPVLAGLST